MALEIRHPKLNELENAISVFYAAFKGEFNYIFGRYFEYGKRLLINFYKRTIGKKDLKNFVIAKINNKIVGAANLDFTNPNLIKYFFYFIKLNMHFLRAYTVMGLKRAIKTTMSMYWFFIENFRTNSCYINLFAVLPKFHNRGIGTKMLRKIEKITKRKKLSSMTLDVAFSDVPARHLYKKVGFTESFRFSHSILKYLNAIEGIFGMKKILK